MERRVSVFPNGRNQAIGSPREFELSGTEAAVCEEGARTVIEPVAKPSLFDVLRGLPRLEEDEWLDPVDL